MGAVKTLGRAKEPELSPSAEKTETVGRAAIFAVRLSDCNVVKETKSVRTESSLTVKSIPTGQLAAKVQPRQLASQHAAVSAQGFG